MLTSQLNEKETVMENSKVLKAILFSSGLIMTGIGGAILFMPMAMFASNGIDLGGNISLLNEIRPPGGALLAIGLLIMSGAFVAKMTFSAAVLTILIYLSYGISRILSMVIDGIPAEGLVVVTVAEIIIGIVGIFAFLKYRENE
jgi:hypothetical protein